MLSGIVLAAGRGARFGGGIPKQYRELAGRRVLDWSLEAARRSCDHVVLVVGPERPPREEHVPDVVVTGGVERWESVRAGLAAVPAGSEMIVVHDGARPLATSRLFAAVTAEVRGGADGAVPGISVVDTIKEVDAGIVRRTLDRSRLVAVQTPQAFGAEVLRHAYRRQEAGTDDASLVERAGGRVVVVEGEIDNLKITHAGDIERAMRVLAARRARASTPLGPPTG